MPVNDASCAEAEFLDVTGTKILRLLLYAIHSHIQHFFTPRYGFLGLEVSTATSESGGGGRGIGFIYMISLSL